MVKTRLSFREDDILCYCDGACTGNPGPGGWGAIVRTPDGTVTELGGGAPDTTNNRMELEGAIGALYWVRGMKELPVRIFTDSSYVIHGITEWVASWKRRGWRKVDGQPVQNRDLWEKLDFLVDARRSTGPVSFLWVKGHSGVPGNERCDRISVAFADGKQPGLYRGKLTEYRVDLTPPEPADPSAFDAPAMKKIAAKPDPKTVSYLSLVDGKLSRHANWDACKALVHGRSNAKFKKCTSSDEERATLASWGWEGEVPPR
jgi:ribonuclease HI